METIHVPSPSIALIFVMVDDPYFVGEALEVS